MSDSNITITNEITISIKGNNVILTQEEAQDLYFGLKKILNLDNHTAPIYPSNYLTNRKDFDPSLYPFTTWCYNS